MSEPEKKISSKTVVILWVVAVCFCAGLVVTIVIPNLVPARVDDPTCIRNLFQLDAAAKEFALEKGKTNGEAINFPDDLTPYVRLDKNWKIPACPLGGVYSLKKVGDKPTCSLGTTVTPAHVLP
jgi:hypothetical protein